MHYELYCGFSTRAYKRSSLSRPGSRYERQHELSASQISRKAAERFDSSNVARICFFKALYSVLPLAQMNINNT